MGGRGSVGEEMPVTDDQKNLDEVQRRLREIQRRKRPNVRWAISRHTAELALDALESHGPNVRTPGPAAKARRRKRYKRLL